MAEHLDNLLPVDHFLDIAVNLAKRGLLLQKVFCRLPADPLDHHQHHGDACQHEQRQPHIGRQHGDKHRDDRHYGGEHLRDGLAEHLLQRVCIIGKMAHQVAVGMGVKIADGQGLHTPEHLVAHLFQNALRNGHHQPVIQEGGNNACQIDQAHQQDGMYQAGEYGRGFQQQRCDIIVDQHAQEHRTRYVHNCGDQNAHQNHAELNRVAIPDIV